MTENPQANQPVTQEQSILFQINQLLAEDKQDEALGLVDKLLSLNPNHENGLYLKALLEDDRETSIEALRKLLSFKPDHNEAKLLLNRLLKESGSASALAKADTSSVQSRPVDTPAPSPQPQVQQQPSPAGHQQSSTDLTDKLLAQHHMIMQQQLLNQQQIAQQHMMYNAGMRQPVQTTNSFAFWTGFLAAFFLGIFGVSYALNGQILTGILYFVLGLVWDTVFVILILTIVGALVAVPLHILFAYLNAKEGAQGYYV